MMERPSGSLSARSSRGEPACVLLARAVCVRAQTHTLPSVCAPPAAPAHAGVPPCTASSLAGQPSCRRHLLALCPLIHLACQPVPGAPVFFTPSHLAAQ